MARFTRVALVGLALSCGGSNRRPMPPTPRSPSGTPLPEVPASFVGEPGIRVGLTTTASVVRLTSSRPFRIGSGSMVIDTADVLVERESSRSARARGYRVQVASYPDSSSAASARALIREELEEDVSLAREAGTGRYALRVGTFATFEGAEVSRAHLVRQGFEGATIVMEEAESDTSESIAFVLRSRDRTPIRVTSLELRAMPASREAFIEVDGSPYRGHLEIRVNPARQLSLVNVVPLEQYLRGVVPAELSPDVFPEKEALKAQAIAARTYATKRMGEYAAEGFDICSTPACQVYRGVSVERRLSDDAVRETAGELLTFDGEPVDALYTSTCGGRTESVENVFSTPLPYLVSRACALERSAPVLEAMNAGALGLEAALVHVLGIEVPSDSLTQEGLGRLVADLARHLGQTSCAMPSTSSGAPVTRTEAVDVVLLAKLLAGGMCWERRARFMMSRTDAERIVGSDRLSDEERFYLAYAIREGFVRPAGSGIRPGTPLSRDEVLDTVYRVLASRGEPLLRDAVVVAAEPGRLRLRLPDDEGTDEEISAPLGPETFLYREVANVTYYEPTLVLLPNDRVSFHLGEGGVDVLVARSDGASFDRSSRFSHWSVRKTAEDLTKQVNAQHAVGAVLDLRPLRYGQSGRLAELQIIGRDATVTVRGLSIRRVLGLRENLFFFDRQVAADGGVKAWVFTGRGWGHGVGLCQVGAYGMAAAGYDYRAILAHYYPGTELVVE